MNGIGFLAGTLIGGFVVATLYSETVRDVTKNSIKRIGDEVAKSVGATIQKGDDHEKS